jgi:hypothetical protein
VLVFRIENKIEYYIKSSKSNKNKIIRERERKRGRTSKVCKPAHKQEFRV